jgi:hypothetical protein
MNPSLSARHVANPAETVIVTRDFSFTLPCTREAGAGAHVQLAPARTMKDLGR